ncbi:hypothetical protein GMRT_12197 [Giardia muris]|uniref:Uncharacterized protein n=1 Tax=Giardia muris TaxID=5742 RepID=A0A4Z1SS34_GIAMU|nr:hypothetical protein GMRT_12197 [Giardia muris]|eukprot:TNJ27805.1 hypothetical protein GMRT_12197 [Giardia muris]
MHARRASTGRLRSSSSGPGTHVAQDTSPGYLRQRPLGGPVLSLLTSGSTSDSPSLAPSTRASAPRIRAVVHRGPVVSGAKPLTRALSSSKLMPSAIQIHDRRQVRATSADGRRAAPSDALRPGIGRHHPPTSPITAHPTTAPTNRRVSALQEASLLEASLDKMGSPINISAIDPHTDLHGSNLDLTGYPSANLSSIIISPNRYALRREEDMVGGEIVLDDSVESAYQTPFWQLCGAETMVKRLDSLFEPSGEDSCATPFDLRVSLGQVPIKASPFIVPSDSTSVSLAPQLQNAASSSELTYNGETSILQPVMRPQSTIHTAPPPKEQSGAHEPPSHRDSVLRLSVGHLQHAGSGTNTQARSLTARLEPDQLVLPPLVATATREEPLLVRSQSEQRSSRVSEAAADLVREVPPLPEERIFRARTSYKKTRPAPPTPHGPATALSVLSFVLQSPHDSPRTPLTVHTMRDSATYRYDTPGHLESTELPGPYVKNVQTNMNSSGPLTTEQLTIRSHSSEARGHRNQMSARGVVHTSSGGMRRRPEMRFSVISVGPGTHESSYPPAQTRGKSLSSSRIGDPHSASGRLSRSPRSRGTLLKEQISAQRKLEASLRIPLVMRGADGVPIRPGPPSADRSTSSRPVRPQRLVTGSNIARMGTVGKVQPLGDVKLVAASRKVHAPHGQVHSKAPRQYIISPGVCDSWSGRTGRPGSQELAGRAISSQAHRSSRADSNRTSAVSRAKSSGSARSGALESRARANMSISNRR